MELEYFVHDMKLKYPFSISRHTYYSQPNVIMKLHFQGYSGYGEATVNPYYQITIDNLSATFDEFKQKLADYEFSDPDKLFEDFSSYLAINSFALGALNNASWDLYGKMQNASVRSMLSQLSMETPLTSYTLGISNEEEIAVKMEDCPWPIYKIKLGSEHDMATLDFIRERTNSVIRVDANCAWNVEQTIRYSARLKEHNVEFIEQPLKAGDPGQKACFQKSQLPLMADESCCKEKDVETCAGLFHGINIKLLKCGGISPALRMVKNARKLGLKIMIGCMTETSIGISAAAQLLSLVDYADLDGPLLLADDLADGLEFENGRIYLSEKLGLGIELKRK